MSESIIRADAPLVTLINVFTADPGRAATPHRALAEGHRLGLVPPPGLHLANLHPSLDGTKVVNYAQWESQEAFQAMLGDPNAGPLLSELAEIATPAPVLCEVVSVHHA